MPAGIKRAAVVVPPVHDFYFTPHRCSALGAHIVVSIAAACGLDVQLHVFPLVKHPVSPLPLPQSHEHLAPYLINGETGPVSYFTRYQRFGPPVETCANTVLSGRPDIVLISCFAFCYAADTIAFASRLKKLHPSLMIICGGAGVSVYPDYFQRTGYFDAVFQGEAETGLKNLLHTYQSNTTFSGDTSPVSSTQKGVATSAHEIAPVFSVTRSTDHSVFVSTMFSRGCPRRCAFCANRLCHGEGFRTIPIAAALDAIASFPLPDAGSREIRVNFEDDNLLADPDYFFALINAFRQRFPNVSFYAENGIDYTLLSPHAVNRLIESGMRQFNLSLASIDPQILASQHRDIQLQRYEQVIDLLSSRSIPSITYFICGLEGDTPESVCRTINYLASQNTLIGISLFYPVPGLPGFTDRSVFDNTVSRCAGSAAWPWTGSLTTKEMITAFRLCRFINLCRKPTLTPEETELIARTREHRRLHTWVREGKKRRMIVVPNLDDQMQESVIQDG